MTRYLRPLCLWLTALLCVTLLPSSAQQPDAPPARAVVELVFVLDTTGSMSGLIQAAKTKIWSIANTMATAKPTPSIKIGLVAYRDRNDAYVTKLTALNDDLDTIYTDLMAFQAAGGGDGPESVNQALHEAVTKMTWSKATDTYKVIFLVGDFPPHMDYQDDVKYAETCKLAVQTGIIINTIQCGNEAGTVPHWQAIARGAEGTYFRVEQSGGAILATTPFDEELAKLSSSLDGTRVYYGTAEEQARGTVQIANATKNAEDATNPMSAARAEYMAGDSSSLKDGYGLAGTRDLVNDIANARVKLAELDVKLLPENMQKMTLEERMKYLAEQDTKRKELLAKVTELSTKRQQYLLDEMKKQAGNGAQSLDMAIFNSIKAQGEKKNLKFSEGPKL